MDGSEKNDKEYERYTEEPGKILWQKKRSKRFITMPEFFNDEHTKHLE